MDNLMIDKVTDPKSKRMRFDYLDLDITTDEKSGTSSDEASEPGCVDVQTSVLSSQIVMGFSSGKEDGFEPDKLLSSKGPDGIIFLPFPSPSLSNATLSGEQKVDDGTQNDSNRSEEQPQTSVLVVSDTIGKEKMVNTETDALPIVIAIEQCPTLAVLNLQGNSFEVEACNTISRALEKRPLLKKLVLRDMFTTRSEEVVRQALTILGDAVMKAGAALEVLDLSDNALGPNAMDGVVRLLESKACYSLKELHMNNCGLGPDGGKKLKDALLKCLDASKKHDSSAPLSLLKLDLGKNHLEDSGAFALSKLIKAVGTLLEIVMPQNSIEKGGVRALADALKHNPSLTLLNLNDNIVKEDGADAIAKALPSLPLLEVLNLGDCLIRDGAEHFVLPLSSGCNNLTELYLDSNEISYLVGKLLVNAVKRIGTLRVMDLNGNEFRPEERTHLGEILKKQNVLMLESPSDEEDEN